jgi:hypothetical protein
VDCLSVVIRSSMSSANAVSSPFRWHSIRPEEIILINNW